MTQPQPDELVNVAISGATVQSSNANNVVIKLNGGPSITIPTDSPKVTIERSAPAQWPPQAGDEWTDARGKTWFAFQRQGALVYISEDSEEHISAQALLDGVGPLMLAYRKP